MKKNTNTKQELPKEIDIVENGKLVGKGLSLDQILFDENEIVKELGKEITVIDESLPFKDSMGFYVIDSKYKSKPVICIVLSTRDRLFWTKKMKNNNIFCALYNYYCHDILNDFRNRNTDYHTMLYYPSICGKEFNDALNKIYSGTL